MGFKCHIRGFESSGLDRGKGAKWPGKKIEENHLHDLHLKEDVILHTPRKYIEKTPTSNDPRGRSLAIHAAKTRFQGVLGNGEEQRKSIASPTSEFDKLVPSQIPDFFFCACGTRYGMEAGLHAPCVVFFKHQSLTFSFQLIATRTA